jgi:prolyl 4-hydroxylase
MQGRPLNTIEDLVITRIGAICTNGNFLWPGVRVGHVQYTLDGYKLTTLSLRPLVLHVDSFLGDRECNYIKNISLPHMGPSATSKMDHDLEFEDTKWRTSSTYFLPSQGDELIEKIDKRVADLTNTRVKQQEDVQVLRYEVGQHYGAHHDFFDLQFYQKDVGVLQQTKNGRMNRFITVLWYLSDVEEGGHTIFPMSFGLPSPIDHDSCDIDKALKIAPKRGQAIIFYNLYADGSLDERSLHGACHVIKGEKWAANKWIW